ncbi:hypothetical protein ACVOMV_19710 [Mesorhizobium atlanticum]
MAADVDVEFYVDPDVAHFVPGDPVGPCLLFAAQPCRELRGPSCGRRAKPSRQRDRAEFNGNDPGRLARPQLGDKAIHLADLDLLAIDDLLVQYIAQQLHHVPPNI